MNSLSIISFDAEGTLVTPRFSNIIWNERIPALYAEVKRIGLKEAKEQVQRQYQEVGPQRKEWYNIKYWFKRFGLNDYQGLLHAHKHEICYYPEVEEALQSLSKRYKLIVVSNSSHEFLDLLIEGIRGYFVRVFSAVSEFDELKSPDFYLRVCQDLQIAPVEMAHVGDMWDFDFLIPAQLGVDAFYLDREGVREGNRVVRDLREFAGRIAG